ncbi:hypothetical protein [Paractinoplanes toevensis]|uniref:Uncharacterized protein n=1 Tax=Paractinoplanes toevensis TaxID=571911 RepID=A0A919WDV8_9ACTN|nr:hypothetical protein [Actinoplanes toevensis]GIM98306.1 hypothetical protein Ato02nite_100990 [Actinoplanes toevensis]
MAARSWSAVLTAVLMLLTACDSNGVELDGGTSGLAKGESWEELRQQARASLAHHDQEAAKSPSQAPNVSPSAWDPDATTYGMPIDSAAVDAQGTRMTVTFTGPPGPSAQSCGADYAAEPVESDKAVVVIVLEQRSGYTGVCTMIGMTRTAALNLAKPLGKRAVLTILGDPVSVTRAANTK